MIIGGGDRREKEIVRNAVEVAEMSRVSIQSFCH